jgi:hypothetical protein
MRRHKHRIERINNADASLGFVRNKVGAVFRFRIAGDTRAATVNIDFAAKQPSHEATARQGKTASK